jgi:hypothetical protein
MSQYLPPFPFPHLTQSPNKRSFVRKRPFSLHMLPLALHFFLRPAAFCPKIRVAIFVFGLHSLNTHTNFRPSICPPPRVEVAI